MYRQGTAPFLSYEEPGGGPTWLSPLPPGMVTKARELWTLNECMQPSAKVKGAQNLAFAIGLARKCWTGTEKKSQRQGSSSFLGLKEK